jgi:GAF domain-containing protein
MLAVWREGGEKGRENQKRFSRGWSEAERAQVQAIATSLALAVVLDQRYQWQEAVQAESMRKMLSETLHQVSRVYVLWFRVWGLGARCSPKPFTR